MNDPRNNDPLGRGPNAGGPGNGPRRPQMSSRTWLTLLVIIILFNLLVYAPLLSSNSSKGAQASISYTTFENQVKANNVKTAHISSTTISGDFKDNKHYTTGGKTYPSYTTNVLPVNDPNLIPLLQQHHVQISAENQSAPPG